MDGIVLILKQSFWHMDKVCGESMRITRTHELGAEVDGAVLELNLFGHAHTVLGDARRAVGLVQDHIASLQADCSSERTISIAALPTRQPEPQCVFGLDPVAPYALQACCKLQS
jgi:hypothetical protein